MKVLILLIATVLFGCTDPEAAKRQLEAQQRAQAESDKRDALEKEANQSRRDWYLVKIGKFDGECQRIHNGGAHLSARADADSYRAGASIESADKSGDDYLLVYSMYSPFYQKIYTTSYAWCRNIINANIEK